MKQIEIYKGRTLIPEQRIQIEELNVFMLHHIKDLTLEDVKQLQSLEGTDEYYIKGLDVIIARAD